MLAKKTMPTARRTFHWSEAFSVHIAILDEQHRNLIDAVNQLDEALRTGEGNSVVDAVLEKLAEYAGVHFATEESLMQQHHFPGLTIHRAQHEDFRKHMGEFLQARKTGSQCVPVSIMLFVETWLKQHLLKSDMLYSAYLNARGVH